jgi:hypothetical protein
MESVWAQSSAASATPAGQTKAAQGKTSPKTNQTQTAASKSGAIRTTATKTGISPAKKTTTTAKTTTAKSAPPARHSYQQQPATDRYKEIQQALADRGYFKGPVDGAWGADSADALKQFQREQKIDEDGKLNSLSLIALGLGPHREIASNPSNAAARRTPAPSAGASGAAGDLASGPSSGGPSASAAAGTSATSGITAGP